MIDVVGYIGTIIVLLSFMMKDMRNLRIISIIGCIIFIIYGYLSNAMPTIIVNVLIIILNLYKLIWDNRKKE